MALICEKCVNYKKGVHEQIDPKECLKSSVESTECLGVSLGQEVSFGKRDCIHITELPGDKWYTPDSHPFYDTIRKGNYAK